MTIRFEKYEGLGNDFLVVASASRSAVFDADVARAICDRHRGVGADGVLSVGRDERGLFMQVVNADGSRPEMCGNGIRCAVLHLARTGLVGREPVMIDTEAGPHRCTVLDLDEAAGSASVEVAMRHYSLAPDASWLARETELIDGAITLDGQTFRGSAVSMGNPHFVIFDAERQGATAFASQLEHHPLFPARVNVGLAEITGERAIRLRVFERGVGFTEACGTGACAAAAAAVETGRMSRGVPIDVTLPGGPLRIVVGERGASVSMTGPARFVFRGEV